MIDFSDPKFDPEESLRRFREYQTTKLKKNENKFQHTHVSLWIRHEYNINPYVLDDASKLISLWVLLKMVKRFGFNYKVTNEWRK